MPVLTAPRTVMVVARFRGIPAVALGVAAGAVAVKVWADPSLAPGRDGVQSLVWPLAPTLPCLVVPHLATRLHEPRQVAAPRSGRRSRLLFVVAVSVSLAALAATLRPSTDATAVVVRNGALLLGMALLSSLLPGDAGWLPVPAAAVLTWVLGPTGPGNEPAPWAVLLHPAGSAPATAVAALAAVAGTAALVVPDRARDPGMVHD